MTKKRNRLYFILLLGSFLAAVKMLFWGYGLDEEYQIIMSYRNLSGDSMLGVMHEPHQTSSFLCTFFMWIYRMVTGGYTGVVIWLRFCGTAIHCLISYLIYRICKNDLKSEHALLVALVYFNLVPKQMMIPEFANMQIWFFTLMVLFLLTYFLSGEKVGYLIGCGVSLALEVLSYPSMAIHFLLVLAVVFCFSQKSRVRGCAVIVGTCLLGAVLYVGYFVWHNGGVRAVADAVMRIVTWDGAHVGAEQGNKLPVMLQNLGIYLLWFIPVFGASLVGNRVLAKKDKQNILTGVADGAIIISCAVQLVYWVILNKGYEYLHLHVAVVLVAAILYYQSGEKNLRSRLLLWAGVFGTVLSLSGICLLTNLTLLVSMGHAGVAVVFALMLRKPHNTGGKMPAIMVVLCLLLIVGKGYTMRESRDFNNVLQSKARLLYGPAAGCITDFDTAQIYNRVYEVFETVDLQDENLLVVSASVHSTMNTWYMFDESQVCHYSIINPSFYDERLITYWEMYPEKAPEVIAVECSAGETVPDESTWIMQYVSEVFPYTEVVESYFVRLYIK